MRTVADVSDVAIGIDMGNTKALSLIVANLAAVLDGGHFVIGGGLSSASDLVLPSAREFLVDLVEGYRARPAITVTASMFGPRFGSRGAAMMAFQRVL